MVDLMVPLMGQMLYINQICTPSFPIGLVKTESVFIVISIETGLERWMLVVTGIDDYYPFLAFSDLTYHLEDDNTRMFSGWTDLPDNKDTELGGSNQEASPLASKNNRLVLVPCSCMEVHPYSYFPWCRYFWGLWVSFVMRDEFSVRVTKITSMIGVSWTHTLFSIFNIFKLNELWSYYQKHLNQIILNCITL